MATFIGDDGDNVIPGTAGADTLVGAAGDDTLLGQDGDDALFGNAGDDRLQGDAGDDRLDGGDDWDLASYAAATAGVTVDLGLAGPQAVGGGQGTDTLVAIENLEGGAFGDTLVGGAGENWLAGGAGNDSLVGGDGDDLLVGGAGDDVLDGDGGAVASVEDAVLYIGAVAAVTVDLAAGTATGEGNDTLRNIEHVAGGQGNDTLIGSDADNMVAGSGGDDDLRGGAGFDHLFYDTIPVAGVGEVSMAAAGVQVDLATGLATGGAGNDRFSGFEGVIGSVFDDQLTGDDAANALSGRGGDDLLQGGGGNDTLEGGDGGDLLEGGTGDDLIDGAGEDAFEDNAEDVVVYLRAAGAVLVNLELGTASGADGNDTLLNIDHVVGSNFDDELIGNALDNGLVGGLGDDRLDGGLGYDFVYYGDFEGDLPYGVAATAGVQVDLALGQATGGGGNDTLVGIEGATGSVFDDQLAGDDGNNELEGLSGNDLLAGRGGDDELWGGDGNDGLDGGDGNDTLEGHAGDDQVLGGAGMDWLSGGAGVDTLDGGFDSDTAFFEDAVGAVRVDLTTGVVADDGHGNAETIANVENLHGGDFDDVLTLAVADSYAFGRGGADRLVAAAAGSVLYAGSGADTLVGGAGSDLASYRDDGYDSAGWGGRGVVVNLAAGTATDNWGATDQLSGIENVEGSAQNDLLIGDGGHNLLIGQEGEDTLRGGAGDDTLYGGSQVFGQQFDYADYRDAGGAVQVNLGAQSATGAAGNDLLIDIEGVLGSAFDDSIVGSAVRDLISGGLGDDTIDGGADFDIVHYRFGAATGAVQVNLQTGVATGGEGTDRLFSIEGVIGTDFGDVLTGNGGDNFFRGNAGDDTIDGAGGIDRAAYDRATGRVVVSLVTNTATGADGNDTLRGIENLRGSAFDDELEGHAGNNDIEGRDGNDLLRGLAGSDFLKGEGGNDTLEGGDQQDTLRGGAGNDVLDGGAQTALFEHDYADYTDAFGAVFVDLAAGVGRGAGVGVDTLVGIEGVLGSAHDDVLLGSTDHNLFNPGSGNDSVVGGTGFDIVGYWDAPGAVQIDLASGVVTGGSGNDTLEGIEGALGSGFADRITGDANNNFIRGYAGNDTLDGGEGIDRVAYDFGFGAVNVSLRTNTSSGSEGVDTLSNFENLRGGAFNDTLEGSDGANDIEGRDGNDLILGGAGADTLKGEGGEDTLRGGLGDDLLDGGGNTPGQQFDLADYRDATGAVTVQLAGGVDGKGSASGGGLGSDTLVGMEGALGGASDDRLTGAATDDMFAGGQGADVIDGGAGFDIVHYRFGSATAGVQVNLQSGVVTGGDGDDELISIEGVIGTDFADVLVGSDVNNFIRGNQGDDVIDGGAGFDRAAYDRALGAVTVSLTARTASGADGTDSLSNIENLRGSNFADLLEGDGGANAIEGRDGDDRIVGLAGSDDLRGEVGNDTLEGGDQQDTLRGGAGDDLLDGGAQRTLFEHDFADYTDATGSVVVDLAAGTGGGAGVGNDTLVGIEGVLGSAFDDTLLGSADHNLFNPGAGNDRVVGGDGFDLVGYWDAAGGVQVDLGLQQVTGAAGTDTLEGIEGALGSRHADTLLGDAGNNFLRGYAGDDVIDGGDGIDRVGYDFGTGAVTVSLLTGTSAGSEGVDTLRNIENLRGGNFDDVLEGNHGVNHLEGRDGNDQLSGLDGNDTLLGENGDDRLSGGAGDDLLDGGLGTDTAVYAGLQADYALALTATGVQVTHLAGGDGVDTLVGVERLQFGDGLAVLPTLSLALRSDSGASAADGLTNDGTVTLQGLAGGVAWQYSVDGGTGWQDGSGLAFTLAEGDYASGQVQVRLTERPDLAATLAQALTVDTTGPAAPLLATSALQPLGLGEAATLSIVFDSAVSGFGLEDLVDAKGGTFSNLASSDGGTSWTATFTPNAERLGPASLQLGGSYTDLAGNVGALSNTLALGYAASASVSDGYIRGADVYLDVDGDGRIGVGDLLKGQTAADGSLSITLDAGQDAYDLLATGGTDISTGLAFGGLLRAPAGSTMLSPLTTLLHGLIESGAAADLAAAQARLSAALGLPDTLDFTSYDPLAVAVTQAGTSSAEQKALALDVQAKTLAVANLLLTGAAALQGAAATAGTVTADQAGNAVLDALVQQIASAPAVDLTQSATLGSVLNAAAADATIAASLDAAKQASAVSAASAVLATANQTIASATTAAAAATSQDALLASLSTAVAVQSVVQGDVGTQLANGQTDALPTDREALNTLTQAVDLSGLQLTADQAATADTTPPATPTLALANDNGASASDGITSDGTVRVSGLEAGAVWEFSTDGGAQWTAGSGSSFTLAAGSYAAGQVQARQADAAGNASGVGQTGADLTVQAGVAVDLLAYSWKAHTLLSGVQVQGGSHQATTGADGTARWEAVAEDALAISASRPVPQGEAAATAQAVNLQDAIAVLKMVVGLEVNGAGKPLSPYQAFAADFNADGQVGLGDAIGMLRHVVGLDAPAPQWLVFDEADPTVAARAGLQPGSVPDIQLLLSGSDARLGLVGVLRGDVDGSYAGPEGAGDLDQLQPGYFAELAADKQIDPAQFGIYP